MRNWFKRKNKNQVAPVNLSVDPNAYQTPTPTVPRGSRIAPELAQRTSNFLGETQVERFDGTTDTVELTEEELSLFSGKGKGTQAPEMTDKALEEMLWDHFKQRELVLDWKAGAQLATAIATEAVEAGRGGMDRGQKEGLMKLLAKAGLATIPVLRTGVAIFKLVSEVATRITEGLAHSTAKNFSDPNAKRSRINILAQKGLVGVLKRSIRQSEVRIGTYTYDVVTGVLDPTSLTKLVSSAIRGVTALVVFSVESYEVKQINKILQSRDLFTLEKFEKMPLLGCYLLHEFKAPVLMGLFDAYDYHDIPGQVQEQLVDRLSASDQAALQHFYNEIAPLSKDAFSKINTAPYGFKEEIERRRERSYKDAGIDASPEFIRKRMREIKKEEKSKYYSTLIPLSPPPPGIGSDGKGYQDKGQHQKQKTVSENKVRSRMKRLQVSKVELQKSRTIMGPLGDKLHAEAAAKYILDRKAFIKIRNKYNSQSSRNQAESLTKASQAYVAKRNGAQINKLSGGKK
jgi:hypothetical protein